MSTRLTQPVVVILDDHPGSSMRELIGNDNQFTEQLFGIRPLFIYVWLPQWTRDPADEEFLWELIREMDLRPSEVEAWLHGEGLQNFIKKQVSDKLTSAALDRDAVKLFGYEGENSKIEELIYAALEDMFPEGASCHFPSNEDSARRFEDIPIEELELGLRAYNCLKSRAGVMTLQDLLGMSEADLNAIPNLGPKGRENIHQVLADRGLALRQD